MSRSSRKCANRDHAGADIQPPRSMLGVSAGPRWDIRRTRFPAPCGGTAGSLGGSLEQRPAILGMISARRSQPAFRLSSDMAIMPVVILAWVTSVAALRRACRHADATEMKASSRVPGRSVAWAGLALVPMFRDRILRTGVVGRTFIHYLLARLTALEPQTKPA